MNVNIACVQMSPIYLDTQATIHKICHYIQKASKRKTDLIVFPELIISGYPNFAIANLEYRRKYNSAAISVNGPELEKISKIAKDFGVVIVLGFIESDVDYDEVIYDSSCVIDSDGTFIGTHRKIAPFGNEKVIFKEGDARDIRIFKTDVGKLGIGLCFENLNPLYRRALTLLGEEIHCAMWVTSENSKHIVDCSTRVTAIEGGVFVILSSQVTIKDGDTLERGLTFIGGSGILNPWGKFITGPIFGREEILYKNIDSDLWQVQKLQSRGIEARDDLLSLNVAKEIYQSLYVKKSEDV